MPYIGHAPTNAGQFVLLDDIDGLGYDGSSAYDQDFGSATIFKMQVSGVDVSPSADNLLLMLSGIVQETPASYTVSGSTIVFDEAPEAAMTFYGILMGQSASVGAGTVNEASLEISNAGSNGQYLQKQSANTGGLTWATVDTSTLAPLASPDLTGNPTAPTQSASNNSTRIATTAYADTAVSNLVDSAPAALDTLNELAAALGDDASFSTTVTNSIAAKLPLAGGTMTGNIVMADDTSIGISDSDERIEFDGAGDISLLGCNVGIGTASPAGKLEVAGSGHTILLTDSGDSYEKRVEIGESAGNGGYIDIFDDAEGSKVKFRTYGDSYFTGGNVGIGTTSPGRPLHVHKDGANLHIKMTADDDRSCSMEFANDSGNTVYCGMFGDVAGGIDKFGIYNGGLRMVVDNSGKVGIGTTAPEDLLDVRTDGNTICNFVHAEGNYTLFDMGKPSDTNYIWIQAVDLYRAIRINYEFLFMSNIANGNCFRPFVDDTYDIGHSSYHFDDIYATNGSIQTSDERRKDNITVSSLGLDFVNKLTPVQYKWKDYEVPDEFYSDITPPPDGSEIGDLRREGFTKTFTRTHYGLIAQDVEQVLEDIGLTSTDFAPLIKSKALDADGLNEVDDYQYGLRYEELISPLIKAIQELSAKVEALENA